MASGEVAVKEAEKALAAAREKNNLSSLADALDACVKAYSDLPDTFEALKFAKEVLQVRRQLGDTKAEAQAMLLIGEMSFSMTHLDEALKYEEEAQQKFSILGDRPGKAAVDEALTKVHMARGEPGLAPHRSKGLSALEELKRAIQAKDATRFHVTMGRLENNPAVSKEDVADILAKALEEDYVPTAQFYKETLDMQGLLAPNKAIEIPKQYLYLTFRAVGGLMYGPSFRFCNGPLIDQSRDMEGYAAMQMADDREGWEYENAYCHGIMDGCLHVGFGVGIVPPGGIDYSGVDSFVNRAR
jgi:tetratricopeptide (TPR) repeat protein